MNTTFLKPYWVSVFAYGRCVSSFPFDGTSDNAVASACMRRLLAMFPAVCPLIVSVEDA